MNVFNLDDVLSSDKVTFEICFAIQTCASLCSAGESAKCASKQKGHVMVKAEID